MAISAQKLLLVVNQALSMPDFTPYEKLNVARAVMTHVDFYRDDNDRLDEPEAAWANNAGMDVPTPLPRFTAGGAVGGGLR